jgi:hypothetical protein
MSFCHFLCHFVLVFFDDILIYSKTWQAHLAHVDQGLHLLSKHQIFLKQFKCAFGAFEVEYLGHIVGMDGVLVDPKKIEAMKDWPMPKTPKIFHGFFFNGLLSQVCSKLWKNCSSSHFSPSK